MTLSNLPRAPIMATMASLLVGCLVLIAASQAAGTDNSNWKRADDRHWKRADDSVVPAALQAVLDQQAATIQQLQQQVTALDTRLTSALTAVTRADSQIQKLGQKVAFTAHFSRGGDLSLGSQSILRFPDVTLNTGDGYDVNTGVFTAPVAGDYLFLLHVKNDYHTNIEDFIDLVKAGQLLARAGGHGDPQAPERSTISVTTHLAVGETVYARNERDSATIDRWWETAFTGVLLSVD